MNLDLKEAESPADLNTLRVLFREYAATLPINLSYQRFEEELEALPGAYAAPMGGLWLAYGGALPAGCVAVRPLEPLIAEMKRLYVRDAFRGSGLGRRLAEQTIAFAQRAGYKKMRLDTLHSMDAARKLYTSLGFQEIPAYYSTPIAETVFMELSLP
jgi:ribosomal protein S18 acetylase RimI-like enzyme